MNVNVLMVLVRFAHGCIGNSPLNNVTKLAFTHPLDMLGVGIHRCDQIVRFIGLWASFYQNFAHISHILRQFLKRC